MKMGDDGYSAAVRSRAAAIQKLAQKQNPAFFSARKRRHEAHRKLDVGASQKATDDALFASLGVDGFARLDDAELVPLLTARCGAACRANDAKFFIRLGRVLSERGAVEPGKLADILVAGWCGDPSRPGLCFFTDEALAEFCRVALGNERLTLDVVRKTRQRLGLKKAGKARITKVEKVNGEIIVS
jgi:hypothetical protein